MNELQDFEYLKFKYDKELHDVFGTVLDVFPSMSSPVVQRQVYLWSILQYIKHNTKVAIESNLQLTPKYLVGCRNPAYDEKKKRLPAICYNARFDGYKDLAHLKTINNLMFLDIDDFKTKEEALEYKNEIINRYDWILACSLSLSKLGLHIIIRVDRLVDNKDFNRKYDYISAKYFKGKLDKNGKSLTRYTVIPYDNDIYINETPAVLNIDKIINTDEKSTRSAYNANLRLTHGYLQNQGACSTDISLIDSSDKKGTRSAYINNGLSESSDLGICSVYKEEIISTAYTFSNWTTINNESKESAKSNKLRFAEVLDKSLYVDVNRPIYDHEGIDIIKVNLYPYLNHRVEEGHRTSFLGALTIQMLYLNHQQNCPINRDIRLEIWKFILSTNKKVCDPPLSFNEVIKSFNANCKKFESGDFDISGYRRKQHSFWSKDSTLSANEKRKVTCQIKNEPVITETKHKIKSAMDTIIASGIKLTQEQVALTSGLSLSTVKKYRAYYQELKDGYKNNMQVNIETKVETSDTVIDEDGIEIPIIDTEQMDLTINNPKDWLAEIEDVNCICSYETEKSFAAAICTEITEEQVNSIINRIFERSMSLLAGKMSEVHSRIRQRLTTMTNEEKQIANMSMLDAVIAEKSVHHCNIDYELRLSCADLLVNEQVNVD